MGRKALQGKVFLALSLLACIAVVSGWTAGADEARPAPPDPGTPVGAAFTYQGRLTAAGAPANGLYDFEFGLYRDSLGGSAMHGINMPGITVAGGLFTVQLDMGEAFDGTTRYLQVAVRPAGSRASYTVLSPRQRLGPTPYALALPGLWTRQNETSPNIIGGHPYNTVDLDVIGAKIGGGGQETDPNLVNGDYGAVGGGFGNEAAYAAVVAGGRNNQAGEHSFVGGGVSNEAFAFSTIGGGMNNQANGYAAVVAGGWGNAAGGISSTIAGGEGNATEGDHTLIGGGFENAVSANYAAIGGGQGNLVSATHGFVGGGSLNQVSATWAVVGGGRENWATKAYGTVGGGYFNTASGQHSAVHGGTYNTASGLSSTIPGGAYNTVAGDYGFAVGRRAKALHNGSFVLADSTDSDYSSVRDDSLRARFNGGLTFQVNDGYWFRVWMNSGRVLEASNGAHLTTGGSWVNGCRRASKENFTPLDGADLLDRLAALPVARWNYVAEGAEVTHIGPTAEDFHGAFGLGSGEGIATVDADGVSLAAIQALLDRLRQLEAENAALKAVQRDQASTYQRLQERLEALEHRARE